MSEKTNLLDQLRKKYPNHTFVHAHDIPAREAHDYYVYYAGQWDNFSRDHLNTLGLSTAQGFVSYEVLQGLGSILMSKSEIGVKIKFSEDYVQGYEVNGEKTSLSMFFKNRPELANRTGRIVFDD